MPQSLLEYERHKTQSGELQLPVPAPPEASGVDGDVSLHSVSFTFSFIYCKNHCWFEITI